jgi:TonB family protein
MPGFAASVEPATPIDRPPPTFPGTAGDARGHVKIQFTIGIDGQVNDARVMESTPPGLFDGAALTAMKAWRYQPRRIDGQAVEQPNNAISLEFVPPPAEPAGAATMINASPAFYPRAAYLAGQEGDVTVAFVVDRKGFVKNALVTHSTLPKVFDESALSAIKGSRFRLPTVDGAPSDARAFKMTLPFRLETAIIGPNLLNHPSLKYPDGPRELDQEGYCYVTYSIAGNGAVGDVELNDTGPGDRFGDACLDYISQLQYESPDLDTTGRLGRKKSLYITFRLNGPYTPPLSFGDATRIKK